MLLRSPGVGWDVSAPDRCRLGGRLVWPGCAAALVLGLALILRAGPPSQAGPRLAAVAVPAAERAVASTATAARPRLARCPDDPGVPVEITVAGARAQHTPVEAHGLQDGELYVPQDPAVASWLAYPAVGPGADHGSAVLTTHVNYAHVLGAFGDLTGYRPGQHIEVALADGRMLTYHVVPAASMGFPTTDTALVVSKRQLDADAELRGRIFDFTSTWSPNDQGGCGRLVLVTCTGRVVDHNYLDNAVVFALSGP